MHSIDKFGVKTCGSSVLPEMSRKAKGKYSTTEKRLMDEVVDSMLRKTRSVWLRLDCLNLSFHGVNAPQMRQRLNSSSRSYPGLFCCPATLWNDTECQRGILRERTRSLTRPIVQFVRNSGSPTGRESYGDGAPIVVSGRESLLHGEGG